MHVSSLTHHHCYVVPLRLLYWPSAPEDELVGGQEGLQVARVEGERAPGGGHATVAELEVERGKCTESSFVLRENKKVMRKIKMILFIIMLNSIPVCRNLRFSFVI